MFRQSLHIFYAILMILIFPCITIEWKTLLSQINDNMYNLMEDVLGSIYAGLYSAISPHI